VTTPSEPVLVVQEENVQHDITTVSRGRLVLRRFLRRRLAVVGLIVVVLLFFMAFVGIHFTHWSYTDLDPAYPYSPPSPRHWFGTDQLGKDLFANTMRGLQKSLLIGLLVAMISTGLAAIVGSVAGYFGGWVDRALMWIVDLLLVIPSFLIIAILMRNVTSAGWIVLVLLIALFGWMITARIVRGMTLSLREREFVLAARYSGVSSRGIIFRHLIPNMSSLLIIDATIAVATAIIAESGLSYFGFGVKLPDVSLGTLIAAGTESAFTFPWLFMFSGGLLVLTTLAVSVFGDGLRDALDPSSKRSGGGR